jgi:RNA polymerase-binding transcription factor DksA
MDADMTTPDVADSEAAGSSLEPAATTTQATDIDLDAIAADLADVETALARLDTGTYWTDEVTGEPLSDEWMVAHPTARRTAGA